MSTSTIQKTSPERTAEISESLAKIRARVASASSDRPQTLVAVSKYKPSADILVCYQNGQRDFGENYVQELVDKAKELPEDIQWHFIGTLQSNKAKLLASIPNLHTVQTVSSEKAASALNKALSAERTAPLNILIQVNTSGEDAKSGLAPLTSASIFSDSNSSDIQKLAEHVVSNCPRLRLQGLMTIGALDLSLSANEMENNADFEKLKETRDVLQRWLQTEFGSQEGQGKRWGDESIGKLLLSMGMSSDFEAALKAGSDIVRVGTDIFGSRKTKDEMSNQ
ncbi:hypothetical protein BDP27DRAFT_1313607 [Rhodocollybia butyracea]|uniref:Pyridoxal phosphate homeostasis protein n=1 Tax=Rhodocollybia butyracea TaxID=206335 RepID=A0A9P5Q7I5_9AGAR|nr:hypothetical protein BDP27DRAFT_1313607 [Rhodocollybia butyracea]